MNIKQWKEFFKENYKKDDQCLFLTTEIDIKISKRNKTYFSQYIDYKDYCLCEINTLDCYKYSSRLGTIPYCQKSEWGNWIITVPKFGQLTNKDIYKAIGYVFKQIKSYHLWNIYLDKKHIPILRFHTYEYDNEFLRETKELGIK